MASAETVISNTTVVPLWVEVAGDLPWYAVYTRSRHEQFVQRQLESKGIVNLLPLYQKVSRWKDRTKKIHVPLFPGYLFVRVAWENRLEVLRAFGVVRIISNGVQPLPIVDEQIEAIQRFIESGLKCDPHPYLKVGNRVRVMSGPLQGIEGILTLKKSKTRLVVSVDLIQRSVAVEIDSWNVERI
jgi:transcription antitermination factor NusG